jgi:hypothetical protein
MEIIYAIYKENIIPLVGGVNPTGIEIGLAEYRGWKLCTMQLDEFVKFSEFKLYPISKSIAVGLKLLGKTKYTQIQAELDLPVLPNGIAVEAAEHNRALTEEETVLSELAKDYIDKLELKFITRAKIRTFKDFEDDLADTKLLVEFLLGYIAEDFSTKTDAEKEKYPIKDLMNSFVESLSGKDLRINNDKILNKITTIIKDESIIARIVKSNYVDQLK